MANTDLDLLGVPICESVSRLLLRDLDRSRVVGLSGLALASFDLNKEQNELLRDTLSVAGDGDRLPVSRANCVCRAGLGLALCIALWSDIVLRLSRLKFNVAGFRCESASSTTRSLGATPLSPYKWSGFKLMRMYSVPLGVTPSTTLLASFFADDDCCGLLRTPVAVGLVIRTSGALCVISGRFFSMTPPLLTALSSIDGTTFRFGVDVSTLTPSANTTLVGSCLRDRITCSRISAAAGSELVLSPPSCNGFGPQNDVSTSILCGDGDRDTPDTADSRLTPDP